jgi:hypothetical protein
MKRVPTAVSWSGGQSHGAGVNCAGGRQPCEIEERHIWRKIGEKSHEWLTAGVGA